jgi:hypothetical protein
MDGEVAYGDAFVQAARAEGTRLDLQTEGSVVVCIHAS